LDKNFENEEILWLFIIDIVFIEKRIKHEKKNSKNVFFEGFIVQKSCKYTNVMTIFFVSLNSQILINWMTNYLMTEYSYLMRNLYKPLYLKKKIWFKNKNFKISEQLINIIHL
jgi:hypothetical protein